MVESLIYKEGIRRLYGGYMEGLWGDKGMCHSEVGTEISSIEF